MKRIIHLKEEINKRIVAYQQIMKSTDYSNEYILKWGCDAYDNFAEADFRSEYVKKAEKQFIENNKDKILQLAAEMVKQELEECGIKI